MLIKDLWEVLYCAQVQICNEDYTMLWSGKSTDRGFTKFFNEEIDCIADGKGYICICIKGDGEKYWEDEKQKNIVEYKLTLKQKRAFATFYEDPMEIRFEDQNIYKKDWLITNNKELDPERDDSDDKVFPWYLIINGRFFDAFGDSCVKQILGLKQ